MQAPCWRYASLVCHALSRAVDTLDRIRLVTHGPIPITGRLGRTMVADATLSPTADPMEHLVRAIAADTIQARRVRTITVGTNRSPWD